ncbi:MAG: DUF4131 domain-containing protein [Verrucomicrobia bacterium]|nr:MAG: DUF4131 domain-containing protein [Verrucomicrobiota bacterium]
MDRPLLLPFGAFALGLCMDAWLEPAAPAAAALAALALLAWLGLEKSRPWLLPVALAAAGTWHHAAWRIPGPAEIASLAGPEPRLAELRGRLDAVDIGLPDPKHPDGRVPARGSMAVESWREGTRDDQPARGTIRWRLADGRGLGLREGMVVAMSGALAEPAGAVLPGAFDLREHFAVSGIRRELRVEESRDVVVLEAPAGPDPGGRFLAWAHAALGRGLPDDDAARLIRAQALGWKPGLTRELATPFLRAGTLHVFAISGLHIALVAALVVQVLRLFGVGRGWCGCLVIPVAWGYVAATGWQASAVRSAVMATVVAAGWALRRPSDLPNSLAAAAWLIVVFDPSQLFQPGFQLSFAVVAGMAWWTASIESGLARWIAFDPWVPESHWPWWRRWAEPLRRLMLLNLASSLAAWCASAPLVVHYFHLVSPVSLLANLLVVPLSSLCLTANAAALATASWWPWLSEWFNQSAWVWMHGMMWASQRAAELPAGHWYTASPPWPWWIGYVAAMALVARWDTLLIPARRRATAVVAGWLAAAACVWIRGLAESRLVVSAGGEMAFFERGFDSLLVDCGPRGFGDRVALPWLRSRGVDVLDTAVLAVAEARFRGGWDEVAAELPPRRCAVAGRMRSSPRVASRQENLVAGWQSGPWQALWPEPDAPGRRADDLGAVLAGDLGGFRCLLVPALGEAAQRRLARANPAALRADVVIAGIPSHGEPLLPEFLGAVRPRWVIVGCASRPAPHRLTPAARSRLRAGPWRVHFTDEEGWVEIRVRPGHARMETATDRGESTWMGGDE